MAGYVQILTLDFGCMQLKERSEWLGRALNSFTQIEVPPDLGHLRQ